MQALTSWTRRTRRRFKGWSLRLLEHLERAFLGTIAACGATLLAIVLLAPVRLFVGDIGENGASLLIYGAAIGFSLIALSSLGERSLAWEQDAMDVSMILAGAALLYLLPFTIATLKSLQPGDVARWLARREDYEALDDLMRRAVNDGSMTLLRDGSAALASQAMRRLTSARGTAEAAAPAADVLLSVGRHAVQRTSPDSFRLVVETIIAFTQWCDAPPRYWRPAYRRFNDTLVELYTYEREMREVP